MEELTYKEQSGIELQKELYVATLVHDLKNPLNAQISILEQFYGEKFGYLTKKQKEILTEILMSAKFMKEMLSSLLSVYKFENGIVKLNKSETNINSLIKICLKEISALAEERHIVIEYENRIQNPILFCDENYMKRVITNMLNNLVTYSYQNTKSVIILDKDIFGIIIKFQNIGFPIKEDLKPYIFEKYTTGVNGKIGTGLGLYFCKKVIEAHCGTISLNSNNSEIEFVIKLPEKSSETSVIKFI